MGRGDVDNTDIQGRHQFKGVGIGTVRLLIIGPGRGARSTRASRRAGALQAVTRLLGELPGPADKAFADLGDGRMIRRQRFTESWRIFPSQGVED